MILTRLMHNCVSGIAELRHTDPSTCATVVVFVIPISSDHTWCILIKFYHIPFIMWSASPIWFSFAKFLFLHIPVRVNYLFNFATLFLSCGQVHISQKIYRFFYTFWTPINFSKHILNTIDVSTQILNIYRFF